MKNIAFLLSSVLLWFGCEKALTSSEIISRSVKFHDPANEWSEVHHRLYFEEYRPDGVIRKTSAAFDLPNEYFHIYRQGQYEYQINRGTVTIDSGAVTNERALTIKNYYLYLWGLPMKLQDPQTDLGNWKSSSWQNRESLEVPVYYEKDTWYFHFDPVSYQMIGYKFYSDSSQTKGETILLNELATVSKMRLPKERSWYTLPEDNYLGKDVLVSSEKFQQIP